MSTLDKLQDAIDQLAGYPVQIREQLQLELPKQKKTGFTLTYSLPLHFPTDLAKAIVEVQPLTPQIDPDLPFGGIRHRTWGHIFVIKLNLNGDPDPLGMP